MRNEPDKPPTMPPDTIAARWSDSPKRTRDTLWFLSGRLSPAEDVRHVPVLCSPFLIGRGLNVTLCLSSNTVSSVHAELVETAASLVLRDLGSTNGTYVNGQRILGPRELLPDDLVQFGAVPFRVLKQTAPSNLSTVCEDVVDQAMALVQFDRLMNEQAVVPHFQPIVDMSTEEVVAFEVLARTRLVGLKSPAAMFSVAAKLSVEAKLSQMIRSKAVQQASAFEHPPHLFLNTHPAELREPGLAESMEAVRKVNPSQRLTLEIHEKAVSDAAAMTKLHAALHEMDVGLAFDDFGAGEARLVELAKVQPDYLKFDISLIHSIHAAPREHRRMVASLVRMVREMGVVPLAEGIECRKERDACVEMGFALAQGFYFGRPVALHDVPQ
jgi:EAL domain-containing protein (putative c-di-GMP-specific phosphodiesterase class I)